MGDNPQTYYLVNKFDESGRINSSVRLIYDGMDTYVYYEKYKYPDDKTVWTKREVFSTKKTYPTEDIISKKMDLKKQVLLFPEKIEKTGQKSTETRIVNAI